MNIQKIRILAVVGPTASGKTALALRMAQMHAGEIVSCDSMQIYRDMDIGTAKPTPEEMQSVVHHLIDVIEPSDSFSAADYVVLAKNAVNEITARGKLPVFCGGTGLYLDSFLRGGFEVTAKDSDLRAKLSAEAERDGVIAMHSRLAAIDPESAAAIHPNNVRRVIRALEIYYVTGQTKTELDRRSRTVESGYAPVIIGLKFSDRDELYRRIDTRVDAMIAAGLVDEVERLVRAGVFERSRTASAAIGYKELLGYVRGELTLEQATEAIKLSTRHYAKRQMTWFSANPAVRWIDAYGKTPEAVFDEAEDIFSERLN